MQRFWVVNSNTLIDDNTTLVLESRGKPRIAEGDGVVLYERGYKHVLFCVK